MTGVCDCTPIVNRSITTHRYGCSVFETNTDEWRRANQVMLAAKKGREMAGPAEANGWGPPVTVRAGDGPAYSDTQLHTAAKRAIQGQYTTLWGRSFNIIDEPDVAAAWLASEVRKVLDYLR